MTLVWFVFIVVFIGYPFVKWFNIETEARLRRGGVKLQGRKANSGRPPPRNKLPPVVGGPIERRIIRKL